MRYQSQGKDDKVLFSKYTKNDTMARELMKF